METCIGLINFMLKDIKNFHKNIHVNDYKKSYENMHQLILADIILGKRGTDCRDGQRGFRP